MKRLLTALMLAVLAGCSGDSTEAGAPTTTAVSAADLTTLSVTQDIRALPASEFNVGLALVSSQLAPGETESSSTEDQLSPAGVARQEQLLRELNAQRNIQGIVVSLPEVVLFDSGRADLRADADTSLDKVGELLQFYPGLNVSIEGHTDDVGSDGANQTLSERRAEAVRTGLASRGAHGGRLSTSGFGESRPAVPNNSDANRQKNRRVEVLFRGA